MRLLLLFVLVGCSSMGVRGLDKGSSCVETPSVVDSAEVTSLGFSAADLLAQVGVSTSRPLVWVGDASETTLTTELTWDGGEVRFISSVPETADDTGAVAEIDAECGDSLEVDATLAFSTADGVFAETWPVTLRASTVDSASFSKDLDAVALAGTFDKWDYADPTADYESLGAEVSGTLTAAGGQGEVMLRGEGFEDPDCTGDGCVVWSSRETAASWGEE